VLLLLFKQISNVTIWGRSPFSPGVSNEEEPSITMSLEEHFGNFVKIFLYGIKMSLYQLIFSIVFQQPPFIIIIM
jgi:hypothetical protein